MTVSATEPSGRIWLITRRLFHPPRLSRRRRRPSAKEGVDLVGLDVGEGLAGLVIAITIFVGVLAIVEFWPLIIFVIELLVVAAAGCVHALRGRRIVMAESDGDVWSWTVKGQPASVRLAERVAEAVREGTPFPVGGRLERAAPDEDRWDDSEPRGPAGQHA
jgi:hypothetical protein